MEIFSPQHRKYWIATSIILLSGIFLGVNAFPWLETSKTEKRPVSVLEELIYLRVNNIRRKHEFPALKWTSDVAEVARRHSEDMARKGYFAHQNREGELVPDRLKKAGIAFTVSGENIFKCLNYPDAVEKAIEGWMASPGHRANILNKEVTETGVGIFKVKDKSEYYITQNFIKRAIRLFPSPSTMADQKIDEILTIVRDSITKASKRRKSSPSWLKKEIYRGLKSSGFPVEKDFLIEGFLKDQSGLERRVDMVVNRGLIIHFTDRELKTESEKYNKLIHPMGYSAAILIRMNRRRIECQLLRMESTEQPD